MVLFEEVRLFNLSLFPIKVPLKKLLSHKARFTVQRPNQGCAPPLFMLDHSEYLALRNMCSFVHSSSSIYEIIRLSSL